VLSERLQEVEAEAGVDKELPAAFDRELQRVTAEVEQATERLRSVQIRKRALSGRSAKRASGSLQRNGPSGSSATSNPPWTCIGGLAATANSSRRSCA
jgi:hypothetical protein